MNMTKVITQAAAGKCASVYSDVEELVVTKGWVGKPAPKKEKK